MMPPRSLPIALALALLLPGARAFGASVVPPEICVEGDPVQLLSYAKLPMETAAAQALAQRAGLVQQGGRLTILGSFALGSALTLGGMTLSSLGAYRGQTRTVQGGVILGTIGLGVGIGGVFGGQRLLAQSRDTADLALSRERDATGREIRWRTPEEPCANDYLDAF